MKIEEIDPESRSESDELRHMKRIYDRLGGLQDDLREDIEKMDAPQAKAIFETTAETIGGLMNTFEDYVESDEEAWEAEGVFNPEPGC